MPSRPASALRFYEAQGLVAASRTSGGQRRYQRNVLRRLAFIRAALPGASVERVAHLMDGAHVCAYEVHPAR